MIRRLGRGCVAALTLMVAGAATAVAVGTSVADASATSHTLKFSSLQTSEKRFAGNHFVDADKDVAKGKVIGYDVLNGVYHAKSGTFVIDFAAALAGGVLYCHGRGNANSATFHGTVTGGTGTFKGAGGSVVGTSYGKQDQNEKLVVTYRT